MPVRGLLSYGLLLEISKNSKHWTGSEVARLCPVGKIQPNPFAYILSMAACLACYNGLRVWVAATETTEQKIFTISLLTEIKIANWINFTE